ncbi:hypothetical protein NtRootA9_00970 [Arthrobacter sp. NtRootA9]|nr:hypothetical protein NtRootA9_00970 [Arthrobacter sp. NtRootA9]
MAAFRGSRDPDPATPLGRTLVLVVLMCLSFDSIGKEPVATGALNRFTILGRDAGYVNGQALSRGVGGTGQADEVSHER